MTTARQPAKSAKHARKPAAKKAVAGAPVTARIFRNGRSDAVRIPRAMALNCKEVELVKTSEGILIRPIKKISMKEFWERLDAVRAMIPGDFMLERPDQGEYQERESF